LVEQIIADFLRLVSCCCLFHSALTSVTYLRVIISENGIISY